MGWLEAALWTQSILGPLRSDCDTSLWALASWMQRHICQSQEEDKILIHPGDQQDRDRQKQKINK